MLSGLPLGAMPQDTAEFLLGRVAVTPVLIESTGAIDPNTQDWTQFEIDGVLQKVHQAMQWWVDTLESLETVHELEFVFDEAFARQPYQTPYEPIDRISDAYQLYVSSFLQDAGHGAAGTLEDAMRSFNHSQRLAMDADWAFTIFVVDSSDDSDGQFAGGGSFGQAFAFAGGLFMITPSTRPASTIAHETGHMFWARDEYTGGGSWTDHRGYYNTQNTNAADNPTPGFVQETSIMSAGVPLAQAYDQHVSPASTLAMVGWQDSDGDGIVDVADVPLRLTGSGAVDTGSGRFLFEGFASAEALPNRNSSGLQNDITLNRVSRIEYRIDGGPWLTAASPDLQATAVSLSLPVPAGLQTIQLRAVDDVVGVVSPTLTATPLQPAANAAALSALAFVDSDGDGTRDANESLLPELAAQIVAFQGGTPPLVRVDPDDYSSGPLPNELPGVTLTARGVTVDGRVGVQASTLGTAESVFAFFDLQTSQWRTGWSQRDAMEAVLEQAATEVRIDAVGRQAGSIGRLEAYDSQGNLLDRATSSLLAVGQVETLKVADPQGRIASVRAFGHARTTVALDHLRIGPGLTSQSDAFGVLRFENLPDGTYDIQLESRLAIHQVPPTVQFTVVGGQASPLQLAVQRVRSPWQNPDEPADVDANGEIQPLDALRIINHLNRTGGGLLQDGSTVTAYYDPSGDGSVTPLDAILVINALNRHSGAKAFASLAGEYPPSSARQALAAEAFSSNAELEPTASDVEPTARGELPATSIATNAPPAAAEIQAVDLWMAQLASPAQDSSSSAFPPWPLSRWNGPLLDNEPAVGTDAGSRQQAGMEEPTGRWAGGILASVASRASNPDRADRAVGAAGIPIIMAIPFFPEPFAAEGFKDGGAGDAFFESLLPEC